MHYHIQYDRLAEEQLSHYLYTWQPTSPEGSSKAPWQALGAICREDTTVLLGGSAALILTNALQRGTNDGDVIASHPDMGQLQAAIRAVAHDRGLPDGWLNGSVQSYIDVLPPDYETRVKTLRRFGRLSVSLLGRRDVIVMKFFSGRPKDLRDLEQIAPTAADLVFTARELPRLAKIDAARAKRMRTVLDAWPGADTGTK